MCHVEIHWKSVFTLLKLNISVPACVWLAHYKYFATWKQILKCPSAVPAPKSWDGRMWGWREQAIEKQLQFAKRERRRLLKWKNDNWDFSYNRIMRTTVKSSFFFKVACSLIFFLNIWYGSGVLSSWYMYGCSCPLPVTCFSFHR